MAAEKKQKYDELKTGLDQAESLVLDSLSKHIRSLYSGYIIFCGVQ